MQQKQERQQQSEKHTGNVSLYQLSEGEVQPPRYFLLVLKRVKGAAAARPVPSPLSLLAQAGLATVGQNLKLFFCGKLTFLFFASIGCESLFFPSLTMLPLLSPNPLLNPFGKRPAKRRTEATARATRGSLVFLNMTIKTYIFRTSPGREQYIFYYSQKYIIFLLTSRTRRSFCLRSAPPSAC